MSTPATFVALARLGAKGREVIAAEAGDLVNHRVFSLRLLCERFGQHHAGPQTDRLAVKLRQQLAFDVDQLDAVLFREGRWRRRPGRCAGRSARSSPAARVTATALLKPLPGEPKQLAPPRSRSMTACRKYLPGGSSMPLPPDWPAPDRPASRGRTPAVCPRPSPSRPGRRTGSGQTS